ncbi:hypothetical protein ACL02S_16670 [Nocardia sp. 004]|uniref:LppU/SCO3897 family protein n=1 Tax=Nocardia sp. 004 TaxID=3385978 RepID=UPI00399EEF36
MGIVMHDQQDNHAAEPAVPPPGPDPVVAVDGAVARRGNGLMWLVLVSVIMLAVAAGVTGYVLTRSEPVALAVEDCVRLESEAPIEYGCTESNALYRIVAREPVLWPLASACVKYSDATKAVAEPVEAGASPEVVLCLAPTRFNMTDPGALQVGDCVEVEDAGEKVTRNPCGSNAFEVKVVATELHPQVPVTDQACRAQPQARQAFAHTSLGGRAIVLCVVYTDPDDIASAVVDDCISSNRYMRVPCDSSDASLRVLTVHTLYQKPAQPQCPDVVGASGFSMRHNEKTDLVLAICLGPVDKDDTGYANIGDCVAVDRSGTSIESRRVDCADPTAELKVIERYETEGVECPSRADARLTIESRVTNGATICFSSR